MANAGDQLNSEATRNRIPTLTDSEQILWMGHPTARSMYGRYVLGGLMGGLYLFFWWANISERPQGEGQMAFVIKTLHLGADLSGVFGLMLVMLILAKIIHFSNGPTSGKWTIMWVVFAALVPALWVSLEIGMNVVGLFGDGDFPLPSWSNGYYFLLSPMFAGVLIAFTAVYQRAFTYAITDRRIHLIKRFMYFDANSQSIGYDRIENLIVETSITSRLLRFGTIQILTASGLNIASDSTSVAAGVSNDTSNDESTGGARKLFSGIGLFLSFKRTRPKAVNEPESCIYGIHAPEKIHLLINQTSDAFRMS